MRVPEAKGAPQTTGSADSSRVTDLPKFPTAPRWYRPVLRAETLLLDHTLGRRCAPADLPVAGGPSNFQINRLGNPIAERTVPGDTLGWNMGQHVARYAWAMEACEGRSVVELGCGNGYGSYLLSWVAAQVTGLDIDHETVAAAQRTYQGPAYQTADITQINDLPDADIAVCFEVLEHLADPRPVIAAALKKYPRVLLSFPNPLLCGSHLNPHHVTDWPLSHLKRELRSAGARSVKAFGQGRRGAAVTPTAGPWSLTWVIDARR